ncbi:sugar phosphate isomerase/epimerase family protein [uncultured Flavonifractor sp.]|uniref:sugar phosphate isomerase/epimerase family protein n=1 Tax=uncultured Flavonifractor sp. TaxID=1193534 RepID=UPI00260FFD57|nr:sugar phosphate isomerase/epimerase family protein [uncultured Flavonifractor sp.]
MGLVRREQVAGMNQHYQNYSLDYFLDAQQRIGFTSIELWCGAQHFWLDEQSYGDVLALRRKLQARDLQVVSLTCPSFSYAYQYTPFSPEVREPCLRYFCKGLAVAEDLGCHIMTVNSGWGCADREYSDAWKASVELLGTLAREAERRGVRLALESLRRDESNLVYDLAQAKRMVEEVAHPALHVMVDTIAAGAAGERLEQWFDAFGDRLIHMHFLDGDPYVHNIWGVGNEPLEDLLLCLKDHQYQGYLVQEVADERYFFDPAAADEKNYQVLSRFFE